MRSDGYSRSGLSHLGAAQQETGREDARRVFDAIDAAMQFDQTSFGTDPTAMLTRATSPQLERTLQGDATLEERAPSEPPTAAWLSHPNGRKERADKTTKIMIAQLERALSGTETSFENSNASP